MMRSEDLQWDFPSRSIEGARLTKLDAYVRKTSDYLDRSRRIVEASQGLIARVQSQLPKVHDE